MSTISQNVSRRSFVAGALAGAGALAAGFVCRPALAADDVKFDDECEVLVVGSGYAGLAAAYEAAEAGAQVRVIDKRAFMGGNSYVADGQIAVVGSDAQKATGGVHGACRLGCNGTLDCLVNGRIAGQSVAAAGRLA